MRATFYFLLVIIPLNLFAQKEKESYLAKNSFDLNKDTFVFPQDNFKIIGFGAYHGSSKTELVELDLLRSLTKQKAIKHYLPETDYSIAHYFNTFLKTGDTILLKDLVTLYGMRVPQERTIEVYEKWKELKVINDALAPNDKLTVVGIDIQVNYKYVSKHILELIKPKSTRFKTVQAIHEMVQTDTTSYALGDLSYAHHILKDFVTDYENNPTTYAGYVTEKQNLEHIIKNLKISFDFNSNYRNRGQIMFDNYNDLAPVYNFKNKPQFLRTGFSHIMKSREGASGYPYFFTLLIEQQVYSKEQVLSVMGYLTDSTVVWDELYDEQGNYTGYTTEAGFGIGDYDKEYFRGITHLKNQHLSDKTLFRLNKKKSPYAAKEPDLIEIIMEGKKSNSEDVKGMSTLRFIDYAVLIKDSTASVPIFEMD